MLEDAIRANCSVDGGVYVVTAGGTVVIAVAGAAMEVSTDVWVSVVTAAGMSATGMSAAGVPEFPGEEVPDEERPGSLAFTWASG